MADVKLAGPVTETLPALAVRLDSDTAAPLRAILPAVATMVGVAPADSTPTFRLPVALAFTPLAKLTAAALPPVAKLMSCEPVRTTGPAPLPRLTPER